MPDNRQERLIADLRQKIKSGSHTLDELALFCKRKHPFVVKCSIFNPAGGPAETTLDLNKCNLHMDSGKVTVSRTFERGADTGAR